MTPLRALGAALAVLAATLAPAHADPHSAPDQGAQRGSTVEPATGAVVEGEALPVRLRTPNRALLVGADEDHALYHSGHIVPGTDAIDYTLVSLADGHVVRTFGPASVLLAPRLVDGSVVSAHKGVVLRQDAVTGLETGRVSLPDSKPPLALDDQWVLTEDAVYWFDGRVVPLTGPSIDLSYDDVQTRGDSDLAVLTRTNGTQPFVVTTATGEVAVLGGDDRSTDTASVFAVRSGPHPEVYGFYYSPPSTSGFARWSDPAHDAGLTLVPSDLQYGENGGFVGERLLVNIVPDFSHPSGRLAEIDPATGEVGATVLSDTGYDDGTRDFVFAHGKTMAPAGDGLVVAQMDTPEGSLSLVTPDGIRSLGSPRPSPLSATRVFQDSGRVVADFVENVPSDGRSTSDNGRGTATLAPGDTRWTPTAGPAAPPILPPDPAAEAATDCPDGSPAGVVDVRGRWQLERCPGGPTLVVDRQGSLTALEVNGTAQLGVDHVAYVDLGVGPEPESLSLVVADLDARHRSTTYGPFGYDFSVDLTGDADPVYVDPAGVVRRAPASGQADTTGPTITVQRRPAAYVSAVEPVHLTYAARARDAVDGAQVTVRVQTRRAPAGSAGFGPWATQPSSGSGTFAAAARPGEQWCFRTAAADRSGNLTTSPASCAVVPVDDREVPRSAAARRVSGRDYLGGAATVLTGAQARLTTRALAGSQVAVWLRTGPGRGTVVVRQGDRVVQRVETAARQPGLRVVRLAPTGTALRLSSDSGRAVLVDAIGYRRAQ